MIRPAVAGAMPVSVDESSIKDIPGARVVWNQGFLGVVADKEWDAIKAAQQLKVTWSNAAPPFPDQASLYDHIRKAPVRKQESPDPQTGNVDDAFKGAARVIEAEYEWPFQSHASMGPACAVVEIKNDQVTLWTGSQKPHFTRDGVAAYSACRRRKCALSGFPGQARMAVTTPAMQQWMPRYWLKPSAGRSGCNTCAIRRPDGIRKHRLRSIARARRSMPPAK